MTELIVAGSEPEYIYDKLRYKLGSDCRRSNEPENYGVDYLVGNTGVQRKSIDDFIASIVDDRLHKEILQSVDLGRVYLLLEGEIKVLGDGTLFTKSNRFRVRKWTYASLIKNVHRLQDVANWGILYSPGLQQTPQAILGFYSAVTTEAKGLGRVKRGPASWARADSAAWLQYLLQSIPGLGPATAKRLVAMYPNPVTLNLTRDELLAVEGVGPGTVAKIFQAFGVDERV